MKPSLLLPFRKGNRTWLMLVAQAYMAHLFMCFIWASLFYAVDGKQWEDSQEAHMSVGSSAYDEALWMMFCVAHQLTFGEFVPQTKAGRAIVCLACFEAYWFQVLAVALVLVSQLAGERRVTILGVCRRFLKLAWPSFAAFYALVILLAVVLSAVEFDGDDGEQDTHLRHGFGTGIYFSWCVAHKVSFGEVIIRTPGGRTLTGVLDILGMLHIYWCLAMLGIRHVSTGQYRELLSELQEHPENTALLGAGYSIIDQEEVVIEMQAQMREDPAQNVEQVDAEGSPKRGSKDSNRPNRVVPEEELAAT